MKIKILESATQDLLQGYRFYEQQEKGLGGYFLDTLFSDIDSFRYLRAYTVCTSKRIAF